MTVPDEFGRFFKMGKSRVMAIAVLPPTTPESQALYRKRQKGFAQSMIAHRDNSAMRRFSVGEAIAKM